MDRQKDEELVRLYPDGLRIINNEEEEKWSEPSLTDSPKRLSNARYVSTNLTPHHVLIQL